MASIGQHLLPTDTIEFTFTFTDREKRSVPLHFCETRELNVDKQFSATTKQKSRPFQTKDFYSND